MCSDKRSLDRSVLWIDPQGPDARVNPQALAGLQIQAAPAESVKQSNQYARLRVCPHEGAAGRSRPRLNLMVSQDGAALARA